MHLQQAAVLSVSGNVLVTACIFAALGIAAAALIAAYGCGIHVSLPRRTPMEQDPPDGIRPGLAGTILDGYADRKDITATILDLVRRGIIQLEELPRSRELDWRFVRAEKLTSPDLTPWESTLYWGIFRGKEKVRLSALKGNFSIAVERAQRQLYEEAAERELSHTTSPHTNSAHCEHMAVRCVQRTHHLVFGV